MKKKELTTDTTDIQIIVQIATHHIPFIYLNVEHNHNLIYYNVLTLLAVICEPSGKEAVNNSFSSIATSKFSNRCIIDGNKETALASGLENPVSLI